MILIGFQKKFFKFNLPERIFPFFHFSFSFSVISFVYFFLFFYLSYEYNERNLGRFKKHIVDGVRRRGEGVLIYST